MRQIKHKRKILQERENEKEKNDETKPVIKKN
jgi:hypothetical protein